MAKVTVQELVAKFTGDTKGLETALGRAKNALGTATKAIAAGATAAGAALTAMGLNAVKVIGQNNDLAKSLGLTYSELVKLNLVASESGTSIQAVGSSLGLMQRRLIEASGGSDSAASAFQVLGLKVNDLLQLSPEKQFEAIAQKIGQIQDPALRTATAMDIFGRSGRDLVQMLQNYGVQSAEAEAFTKKFNLSLSQIDVERVGAAEDAMARVKTAVSGLGNTIAVELSPLIEAAANAFLNSGISAETFAKVTRGAMSVVIAAVDLVRRAINGVKITWEALIFSIGDLTAKASRILYDFGAGLANTLNKIPGVSLEAEDGLLNIGMAARKLANDSKGSLQGLIKEGHEFKSVAEDIAKIKFNSTQNARIAAGQNRPGVSALLPEIKTEEIAKGMRNIKEETDKAKDSFQDLGRGIDQSFDSFVDSVSRGEDALESLKKVAFDVLKSIIDGVFQTSSGGAKGGGIGSAIASTIGSIFSSSTGGKGGASSLFGSIGKIFGFAKGGVISGANMFPIGGNVGVMGEKGAEAIMPLTRGGDGKLGVAAHGGGGKQIVQNINITTGVEQTVRAEIIRMMPQLKEMAVSAVQNANNRGYSA